ncbi:MAG: HNH endonuclease [Steroidobacterales bacterium]
MTRIGPGDVVFSATGGAVAAVGIALDGALAAPAPAWFAVADENCGADVGWEVPVRFLQLQKPLRPREHAAALAPVLPARHSPIRASGADNARVHLAAIPEAMAATLRRLLDGQVEDLEAKIRATAGPELADAAVEQAIRQRTDIGAVQKQHLLRARRGQGVFRQNLERVESACRLTGVLDRRHLRASHIKPWNMSDDREMLDGFNGLLLSPHIEHLFDRGYLSFLDDGNLLVSRHLNPAVLKCWKLVLPASVGAFRPQQCVYLDYHRQHVLDKHDSGHRSWPAVEGAA